MRKQPINTLDEISLRLKAPAIALEKVVTGQYLPKVFVQAALDEIRRAQALICKLQEKNKE